MGIRDIDNVASFETVIFYKVLKQMKLEGQKQLAISGATRMQGEWQRGRFAFFGLNLHPCSQPTQFTNPVVANNSIASVGTAETLFSDYRQIQ